MRLKFCCAIQRDVLAIRLHSGGSFFCSRHWPDRWQIWLLVFRKSHGKLLRPGGLVKVQEWVAGSTKPQRSAIMDLLWSLTDYMTAKRGVTETKMKFGPKEPDRTQIHLIDPFQSNLGRPSSAPIAYITQRKMEQRKRDQERQMINVAEQVRNGSDGGFGAMFEFLNASAQL